MDTQVAARSQAAIPFDHHRVDRLMEEAGIDVLLATSKHNVQYLLGGYKFIFFSAMDAIGHSRYLPVVIYEKGKPEHAAYVANKMEGGEHHNNPFWTPTLHTATWGTVDAAKLTVEHLKKLKLAGVRIGIEPGFLPADAYDVLRSGLGAEALVDATAMLERMRSIKTPQELEKLRTASELITDSMLAVFAAMGEGSTKHEIVEALRREETNRGLQFEYALLTLGSSLNRAVSPQSWQKGEVMSLDFRRQLSGIYRRSLPHGGAGRTGCRTSGSAGRDRIRAAGSDFQGASGSAGRRPNRACRERAESRSERQIQRFLRPWHGPDHP